MTAMTIYILCCILANVRLPSLLASVADERMSCIPGVEPRGASPQASNFALNSGVAMGDKRLSLNWHRDW